MSGTAKGWKVNQKTKQIVLTESGAAIRYSAGQNSHLSHLRDDIGDLIRRQHEMLKRCEWCDSDKWCPACREKINVGHQADCPLAALLKEVEDAG